MKSTVLLYITLILSACNTVPPKSPSVIGNETTNTSIPIVRIVVPRDYKTEGYIEQLKNCCAYKKSMSSERISLYYPNDREVNEVKNILSYVGLPMNFQIYSADIENAIATVIDGKRYLVYDKRLFNYADEKSNTFWTSMAILTHEIGHHLSGHTLDSSGSTPVTELEADEFSGFTLYKMGASQQQAILAMELLGSEESTNSHPNKYIRIQAIEKGWTNASQQRYQSAIPPPPALEIPDFELSTFNLWGTEKMYDGDIELDESELMYGVITDVDTGFNGGGIEIFTERRNSSNDNFLFNRKEMFNVPIGMDLGEAFHNHISKATWSWFSEAFRPGRRIEYRYASVGSGGHLYISYIKVIR